MFQNGFNHEILECNNNSFSKISLRSYLSQKANQFYLNRAPWNQLIPSLDPSSKISEPRNKMINPINNNVHHKVQSNLSP